MSAARLAAIAVAAIAGCTGIIDLESVPDGTEPPPDVPAPNQPPGGASDAAGVPPDAGAPPGCNVDAPFQAPQRLIRSPLFRALSSNHDQGSLRFSVDELHVYFDRGGDEGAFNLWTASRTKVTDPFGEPARPRDLQAAPINTLEEEWSPNVTEDGLQIFFERKPLDLDDDDLYVATRASTSAPFGAASRLRGQVNKLDVFDGQLFTRDGLELWFARVEDDRGEVLHVAKKMPNGAYDLSDDPPDLLATINGRGPVVGPVVSRDGRTLYFARLQGTEEHPTSPMFVATRADTKSAFGKPVTLLLGTKPADGSPTWISNDGCAFYFSAVPDELKDQDEPQDLYVARRPL